MGGAPLETDIAFSNPITREGLQNEFLELQSEIRKTIIFVTHDVFEAAKMADRIALLDGGRLQQLASPAELVENPANEFVDRFLGQHRFQLSLLTKTVKSILPERKGEARAPDGPPTEHLRARASLIEALDSFKSTKCAALPVYERDRHLGDLSKSDLLGVITRALDDTGEAS